MAATEKTASAVQLTEEELEAGLNRILGSPADTGTIELIVRRPAEDQREELEEAELDLSEGLVGDDWRRRGSGRMSDGSANPDAQVTVMNVRVADLVTASDPQRWALAGDQFYVDLDLSEANVPAGTRLALGTAVLEVTAEPHTGCAKFSARFGQPAHRFVNTKAHRHLHLRGINARVVEPGTVRRGDA
ncbi:MAG: MOSC domain-containing protein, partial [Gaiellaceae bacterium]